MTIEVEIAGTGQIAEFPDGTPNDVIVNALSKFQGVQDDSRLGVDDTGVDNVGEGVSQVEGVLPDLQAAFSKIPGVPELAEFAAGVNRSVVGVVDFLGPDTVNAILSMSGSEKRLPTLTESLPGIEGGFTEPGLKQDVLRAGGETAPLALGAGTLLRNLASKVPALAAGGESTATGLLRQVGQTTAGADVGLGTAAGAGQAVGGEIGEIAGGQQGREIGEAIGGVVAPIATIPLSAAKSSAAKLLKKSAPSVDELKSTAASIYKSLDDSGISIESKSFDKVIKDIDRTLRKEGFDKDLHPKVAAVLNRLKTDAGVDKTLSEIDTLRKVTRGAADSIEKSERRLGVIAIEKIDTFLDGIGGNIGGGREAGEAFRSARGLWQRARKAELLDAAVVEAESQASGFENGIRTQFRSLQKKINNGKVKGFTAEERTAIKKVVEGTNAGNVARFLGKFGILDGITSRSLTTLGGAGLAGAAGGPGAAAAVPIVGQLSGALSQRMTANNAKMANAIIRAGKNGKNIARIYIQNTPKADQKASELAELFLKNEAPIGQIKVKNPLVKDAAIFASIARANDKKEQ